jgi:hypothetical protein
VFTDEEENVWIANFGLDEAQRESRYQVLLQHIPHLHLPIRPFIVLIHNFLLLLLRCVCGNACGGNASARTCVKRGGVLTSDSQPSRGRHTFNESTEHAVINASDRTRNYYD